MQIKLGATRLVILVGAIAIKLPRPTAWNLYLHGLLANMQEQTFWQARWEQLCPVWFRLPGGFLVVMPRCETLTENLSLDAYNAFVNQPDYVVPVEHKPSSFGWYQGRLVAVDYGS